MFSDDLGFNPYDKNNDGYGQHVASNGLGSKFLNSFGWKNEIYCYNGDPRKKISSMNHTSSFMEAFNANKNNSDFYFYVNGGRKQYAIDRISACFCDMDAGRDEEGKYFKPTTVKEKKKEFLKKINEFPVQPSWVVDTRNGYQCYWILNDGNVDKIQWKGLQKKLTNHFGGDPLAIKINQIFRMPFTWWRKGWEGKAPYFCSILQGSTGDKVNFSDLKNALDGTPANIQNKNLSESSNLWFNAWNQVSSEAAANGVPVENMSHDERRLLHHKVADMVFGSTKELYDNEDSNRTNPRFVLKQEGDILRLCENDLKNTVNSDSITEEQKPVDLNCNNQQTFLLKKTIEFLNQVTTPLYFSKNQFLSRAAKELADELSDKFCIG